MVTYLFEDRTGKIAALLLLVLCLTPLPSAGAADLTVTGSWSVTIDDLALQSGAGSDLIDTAESTAGEVALDISNYSGTAGWQLYVSRDSLNWSPELTLSVKRVSPGSGGSVSGGRDYQEITTLAEPFLNGTGNVSGIELQFRLSGLSIYLLPDIYNTQLTYMVEEL